MNKSIYQIETEYRLLAENLIDNGGELTPEIETQLSITYEELQQKGVAYSFVIKDQIEIIKQIDEEIDRLEKRKKAKEKAVERLKRKIILQESQNLKTREKTDQQMVAWIKKQIEEEVQCCSNQ